MDLRTEYMGIKLASPVVVGACPLSDSIDNVRKMEDAGAGAVVMFSLFEEQIRQQEQWYSNIESLTSDGFAETSGYFPQLSNFQVGPYEYLEKIRQVKLYTDLPVFGSLNGITNEGWIEYAKGIEEAGADGLEINIFFIPADISSTGTMVEQRYIDIVKHVTQSVRIPVAVKLNPYFSATGNMARRLYEAGASALVLFNRFYQPDLDIYQLKVLPNLDFSHAGEIRLPLLWLALLHGRLPVSLAATTGVQSEVEVIKYLLAGADVAMVVSTLYKHGIDYIEVMNLGIQKWMRQMGFDSVAAFKGLMSQINVNDPTAYERANYIKIVGNS
jgi:dihydroorotate dehydrogenase (fumarate)